MEHELYRSPRSGQDVQAGGLRAQRWQDRPLQAAGRPAHGWRPSQQERDDEDAPRAPLDMGRIAGLAGAVTSLALIVGLGVWGYKLAVRDVQGIPVVRALEGPARVAPADPGGQLASHTGLAVNAVAAEGTATPPADRIVLAPEPPDLAPDARPMGELANGPALVQMPARTPDLAAPEPAIATPVALDPAAGFGAAVPAAGNPAVRDEAGAETAAESSAVPAEASVIVTIPDTVPGVARSPRPPARPAGLDRQVASLAPQAAPAVLTDAAPEVDPVAAAVAAAVAQAIAAPGPSQEIDGAALVPGTPLAQLGAFDDPAAARAEWETMETRFGALMAGKDRVIEPADSGGRAFYRLRVAGFEDASDSRRFCAALLAEGAACIPAQAR